MIQEFIHKVSLPFATAARYAMQASRFQTARSSRKISKTPSLKISKRAPAGMRHD